MKQGEPLSANGVRVTGGIGAIAALVFALSGVTARAEEATGAPACKDGVLDLAEAAALLRVDTIEVERLASSDAIPARRIGEDWRFNCSTLMIWLNGDWTAIDLVQRAPESTAAPRLTETGSPRPDRRQSEATTIGEAPDELSAEDVFLRGRRVLLEPGGKIVDLGVFYSETNSEPLVLVGGSPALAAVEQESAATSIQARFGMRKDSELFLGTSYVFQETDAFAGNLRLGSEDAREFGPVRLGMRKTLGVERIGRPNIIGSIDVDVPTGDTSPTLGLGLVFVKSFDPVALFSNISYRHTFHRDFDSILILEPEDRFDFAFGSAIALNDSIALSMAFSGSLASATRTGRYALRQQDTYALRFGLTTQLESGRFIEPSVSFNLGGPDQGFAFGIAMPYTIGR